MYVKIIQLTSDQWEGYKNLRLEALRDNPEAFGETYDQVSLRPEDLWRKMFSQSDDGRKRWVFFAQINGNLVGMVSGQEMKASPGRVKVREMFVAKEFRGKGIGKKLIQALTDELLKNSDKKVLRLGVFEAQAEALNFYKNLGFKILEGKTETLPNGKGEVSLMEKTLK